MPRADVLCKIAAAIPLAPLPARHSTRIAEIVNVDARSVERYAAEIQQRFPDAISVEGKPRRYSWRNDAQIRCQDWLEFLAKGTLPKMTFLL